MTELPDGSGCFTATILSNDETMALPRKQRPLNHRISGEIYHAVFEAIGEASTTWKTEMGNEVFNSAAAEKIAVDLCFKIANEAEKWCELSATEVCAGNPAIAEYVATLEGGLTTPATESPITSQQAPDFGEPWSLSSIRNCIYTRDGKLEDICDGLRNRSLQAVNACAGMTDPAKEIARFKDCSDELDNILSVIPSDAPCLHAETGETVADYIFDLREKANSLEFRLSQEKHLNTDHEQDYLDVWKLIKRPDETVVQAAQRLKSENEAMRDAIKAAAIALFRHNVEDVDLAEFEELTMTVTAEDQQSLRAALAKLQPHLPAK